MENDYEPSRGSTEEMLANAGFRPGTPIYHFCAPSTLEDLKTALFQSNRHQIIPLSNKLDDESLCPIMVTLVRPIHATDVTASDTEPGGEDIWPDWYVEGKNLWHRQFGDTVRVYFLTVRGEFSDGYIQTIQDPTSDKSTLIIIG
jgi:hypothetical protein